MVKDALQASTKKRNLKQKEKQLNTDQCMAASIGDVEWLDQSLKNGHDPNGMDKNGFAPIHLAALHGKLNCIKLLVEEYGVDINMPSSVGWRPLHLSINKDSGQDARKCVQYLLEHGADVNCINDDKVTVVHQAATEGLLDCLLMLLTYNPPLHDVDVRGHTALDLAKLWGHKKCARVIKDAMWKEQKAKEAEELKKLTKVQEKYYELQHEALVQVQNEREFYGDVTFTNWMEDKGFDAADNINPPVKGKEGDAMKGLEKRLMMSGTIEDSVSKMERLATSFQERRRKRQDDKQDVRKFGVRQELAKSFREGFPIPKEALAWKKLPRKHKIATETWNYSTNVESSPVTNIKQPTTIAIGVEPDEQPFSLIPATANLPIKLGKSRDQTTIQFQLPGGGSEDADVPIPSLPSDVVYDALSGCPSTRIKVPQEFKSHHIEDVTHKRRTDQLFEDEIGLCLMLSDKYLRMAASASSSETS